MTDLFYWIVSGVGTVLCVYSLYLNDFDIEEALFRHTSDEEGNE